MRKIYFLFIILGLLAIIIQVKRFKTAQAQHKIIQKQNQQQQQQQHSSKPKRKIKGKSKKSLQFKNNNKSNRQKKDHQQHHQYLKPHQSQFWWNALLAIMLSCGGGFCSGMTVGLNSLDKLSLQVQKITGNQEDKKIASRILNTISDHHLFLVTLLIGNAMVLEWLPLVVHKIMPDWAAILTSTVAVVIVAEIVPMSATTGPQKVKLAYLGAPLVDFMIKIYFLISYPIARGLDKLLGVHDTSKLKRRDFLQLINYKKKNQLHPLQITIINQVFIGAHFTSVDQIMIPINQIFIVNNGDQINAQMIQKIQETDCSFILISQKEQQFQNFNILSMIKIKQFTYAYLKLKLKNKSNKIFIKDVVHIQFPISVKDKQNASKHNLLSKDDIFNYNSNHKIPVIYRDTGLMDALSVLDLKNSRIALVHDLKRKQQNENMAYLDAIDRVVNYDPYSQEDKNSIIGIISLDKIIQTIVDFNGHSPIQGILKRDQSPPKKRKLVKRASIMSSYSIQNN